MLSLLTESFANELAVASIHKYWKGCFTPALVFLKVIKRKVDSWPTAAADTVTRSEEEQGETIR